MTVKQQRISNKTARNRLNILNMLKKNIFGNNNSAALLLGKELSVAAYKANQFPTSAEKSIKTDVTME
jgi:hypothetical protein